MLRSLSFALALLPVAAFAAGSGDSTPPKPTETTEVCENGQVWDADSKACVNPDDNALNDADRIDAVRELAYAGRTKDALRVLGAMADDRSDMALTYKGFLARASGNWTAARVHYAAAIEANPDNLLARSYLGQGYVAVGDLEAAQAQLSEIRLRGGRQTWPELSLRMAIEGGPTPAY